jgi:DNA-binding GntR family transcriptional regulator
MLGASPGAPAMLERRLAFDQTGRPVDFGTDLYRGDRVHFVTDAATEAVPYGAGVSGTTPP